MHLLFVGLKSLIGEYPTLREHAARLRRDLEIYDRVGGGDGFVSGVIWSLMGGRSPSEAVQIGVAHGALTMTTPGDTSMATRDEVLRAVTATDARAER